jgi:hypothetical protein
MTTFFNGIDKIFQSNLKSIDKELKASARRQLTKAAKHLEDKIKAEAPKDTGDLIKSIKRRIMAFVALVGPTKPKAFIIEHGRDRHKNGVKVGRIEPNPFMARAAKAAAAGVKKILAERWI